MMSGKERVLQGLSASYRNAKSPQRGTAGRLEAVMDWWMQRLVGERYSVRSGSAGSTRAARQAGRLPAISATTLSSATTPR